MLRNIQTLESHLLDAGRISRRVLLIDFDGYEQEQAGRYYVSEEDRRALDAYRPESFTANTERIPPLAYTAGSRLTS